MRKKQCELQGKRFLDRIMKYDAEIKEKKAELAFWRQKREEEKTLAASQEIKRREAELSRKLRDMAANKLLATHLIDSLEDPIARSIMRSRYILGDTWSRVADDCGGMTERNARYIHDHALISFEELYCTQAGKVVKL